MYVVTPYPNVLYAFDLTKEGYPLRWKYRPAVSPNAIGVACCDPINRGASYADGKIIYNLLDGHTVAVDAETGREVWMTTIADMAEGETTPMAPLVAKDRVMVGASGGEFGIYGWLKGLDLKTGEVIWTGHNIGPDADMLVKPGTFKPYYDKNGTDLGAKTGRRMRGRKAARPSGVGYPTTRNSTSCTTAPAIRRRTTPNSVPATTSGREACWRAGRPTGRSCGRTSSRRTTVGTTTRYRP